jgi:hypothetical protein
MTLFYTSSSFILYLTIKINSLLLPSDRSDVRSSYNRFLRVDIHGVGWAWQRDMEGRRNLQDHQAKIQEAKTTYKRLLLAMIRGLLHAGNIIEVDYEF